jgi:hypothetical protein
LPTPVGPHKIRLSCASFVTRRQESDDGIGEVWGRGEAFLGNELGQVAEEALDQIHPG